MWSYKFIAVSAVAFPAALAQLTQCVVPSNYKCSGGTASDSPAINEIFARCSKDSEIIFSEGVEYNVFSPLKATNLSNVVVRHLGNLNLPSSVEALTNATAANGGSLNWFQIGGTDVSWVGTANVWKPLSSSAKKDDTTAWSK